MPVDETKIGGGNDTLVLLDLPAELMILILAELSITELCKLRTVCVALFVLVEEIAKRVYCSVYGSLIDPSQLGTAWAPLLREAEKRDASYQLWSADLIWMIARGMDKRLRHHLARAGSSFSSRWSTGLATVALVEAARNARGAAIYDMVMQLNRDLLSGTQLRAIEWMVRLL